MNDVGVSARFPHWWPREFNKALLSEGFCWLCDAQRLEVRELVFPAVEIGRSEPIILNGMEVGSGRVFVGRIETWGVCPRCGHRYQVNGEQIIEQIPLRSTPTDDFVWAGKSLTPPFDREVTILYQDGRRETFEALERFPDDADYCELVWS